jgi:metallophosphoesterase superfamily enzyme
VVGADLANDRGCRGWERTVLSIAGNHRSWDDRTSAQRIVLPAVAPVSDGADTQRQPQSTLRAARHEHDNRNGRGRSRECARVAQQQRGTT